MIEVGAELWAAGGATGVGLLALGAARDTGGLSLLAWSGGSAWRVELAERGSGFALLALEAVILGITLALIWRSKAVWPVAAAVLQGIGLGALLAYLFDSRVTVQNLERLSQVTTVIAAALLFAGLVAALRQRRSS